MPTDSKPKTYRVRQLPCILTCRDQVASFLASIVPDLAAKHVQVFSLAPSLNPLEILATKVATVMFDRLPPAFDTNDSQWVIPGQSAGLVRDIIVDVHFLDFTPLNDVPEDEHQFDCIAISGLASHPFGSWKERRSGSTFMWLRDRLPREMPNARSIIYGYDTSLIGSESVKGIDDIAIALISKMKSIGRANPSAKPVLMLAHSLGGIVLKQAMVLMARTGDSSNVMISSIRGVVFFGVPNKGMKISHLLPMVEDQPNAHIVHLLSTDSDYLQNLDQQFSGIVTHRGIRILSVYETKRSTTTQKTASGQWRRDGPLSLLVDKPSAIQHGSHRHMPIDEDHSNLVKFGADDQDCQAIIVFMCDAAAEITSHSAKSRKAPSNFDKSRSSFSSFYEDDIHVMINSLYIEETGHRLDDIQAQYKLTFEWIFDEDLGFPSWLISSQELYWISGKPGSGKSTLMKLARQDARTYGFFRQHDPDASHIMIDFFFHDRGSAVQKSLEGLLYRMLYQVMRNQKGLAELVLPIFTSRHEQSRLTWSLHSLRQALNIILTQNEMPVRILLFLDALDEFDGGPETIADFVKDLVRPRTGSATEIKICCSSRPWNVFRDVFSDLAGCKVHEHTRDDIQRYIDGRFESNTRMREMMKREKQGGKDTIQILKDALSTRAEGVFIWVRLVLDDLLKACTDGAIPEELIQTLSSFPDDLDKSYQRLIDHIPSENRFESYVMIETVLRSKDAFGLRDLGLVLLCALGTSPSDSARRLPSNPYSDEFLVAIRRRLQSRCGGMLEVLEDTTVQFMHQTAKEFFSRPGSTEAILRHDPSLWRENGYSFLTKFWLALVSASSESFDWWSYILSMYKRGYITQPHYLAALPVLSKPLDEYQTGNENLNPEMTQIFNSMLQAGFSTFESQDRCLEYAYLSEVSTGRSQREFLDHLQDEPVRKFFYGYHRPGMSYVAQIFSVTNFAKEAGLQVYMDEILRPRRRKRQRDQTRVQHCQQPGPSSTYLRPERQTAQNRSARSSSARRGPERRRAQRHQSENDSYEHYSSERAEPQFRSHGQSYRLPRRNPEWQQPQYQPRPETQPQHFFQDGARPEPPQPQYQPREPHYQAPPWCWTMADGPSRQYHPHSQPYSNFQQRPEWEMPRYPYPSPQRDREGRQ